MKENISSLKQWIDRVFDDIAKVNEIKKPSDIVVYMVGSTSEGAGDMIPYNTPIRKIDGGYVIGSIVFTQTQASILTMKIDGEVDYIFFDAEKKLRIIYEPDHSPYKEFDLDSIITPQKNDIELGNISSACHKLVAKSLVCEYKGNDLTISSVWLFLIESLGELSGKKLVVYGAGNIGSKLALKLVESGANVEVVSRDYITGSMVVAALNKIKNKNVLSNINISTNNVFSALNAHAIIGCTNSSPVINREMINVMRPDGVVIDVGKGTVDKEGIKKCSQRGIKLWRADITPMIGSLVSSSMAMKSLVSDNFGRRNLIEDIHIVSGGFIGEMYDVIVDCYKNPLLVMGVCAGEGVLMTVLDEIATENCKKIQDYIDSKSQ